MVGEVTSGEDQGEGGTASEPARRSRRWRANARILARALRWRRTGSLSLLAVSIVAIAASAVGPAFERSADASAFTTAVIHASPGVTNVSVLTSGSGALDAVTRIDRLVAGVGLGRQFEPPIQTLDAGYTFKGQLKQAKGGPEPPFYGVDLLASTDLCHHVHLVAGVCPAGQGQAAASVRSAHFADLHLGDVIRLQSRGPLPTPVRLTGLYVQPANLDDDYWNNENYFAYGTSHGPIPNLDAFLTTASTLVSSPNDGGTQVGSSQYLRPGSLDPDGFAAFEQALQSVVTTAGDRFGIVPTTGLDGFIAAARHDDDVAATVIEAVALQLVLLALLVLSVLVGLSSAERAPDAEIARRRGFTRGGVLGVAVGEPLVLLIVAFPVGLVLARLSVSAVGSSAFVPGTPLGLDGASVAAGVVALAGGVLAAVVGSAGLWRGTTRQADRVARGRSFAAVLDAIAVALAAAGLVGLATQGSLDAAHPDPLVALAPGLLALGAGVVGLRLAGLGIRVAVRATGQSRRVATFLAVREVARRRPEALRQLLALSVSVVLAVFAVASWSLAAHNRAAVARFQVGAAEVLGVRAAPGVDLVAAVRQADPSGREAMAAEVYDASDGQLLAVDAFRFAAVAAWSTALSGRSARQVASYLAPPVVAPIELSGRALQLTAALPAGSPTIDLAATLYNLVGQNETTVAFAPLHAGTGTVQAPLTGFCTSTCRLVGLAVTSPSQSVRGSVTLAVSALGVVGPGGVRALADGAGDPHAWTASPAPAAVTTRRGGPVVSFSLPAQYLSGGSVSLAPNDVASPVPAVVTSSLAAVNHPAPPDDSQAVTGLDGQQLTVAGEVVVATLPAIGSGGALVDLTSATLSQSGATAAAPQVWLAHPASRALLGRLRAAGLTVVSTSTAAARSTVLGRAPLALGYRLVADAAPVAALLGVGAAAVALLGSRRRRRADRRALQVVGVSGRVVVRALLVESAVVLGTAWVIGGVAGVVASRFALQSLPQFADGTGGIPISHALPVAPVAATLAVLLALYVLTAAVTTWAVFGRGRGGSQ